MTEKTFEAVISGHKPLRSDLDALTCNITVCLNKEYKDKYKHLQSIPSERKFSEVVRDVTMLAIDKAYEQISNS